MLLIATLMLLILPAFFGTGLLSTVLFVTCLSFLLIQSMIISKTGRPGGSWLRYLVLGILLFLYWLEPIGFKSALVDLIRFFLLVLAFLAVLFYMLKFLRKSIDVNIDVIVVSINIYLLLGIVFGSLSYLFNGIFKNSYNFPDHALDPNFLTFVYYSFITMSTVGYGDITPCSHQTQTLAYLISVTGQLYVAIIVAFLVGKLLMKADAGKNDQ
jgi:hypothetical protein